MKDYLAKFKDTDIDSISVVFYYKDGKAGKATEVMMHKLPEDKTVGDVWEETIMQYLMTHRKDIADIIDTEVEPTMLTAYFEISKENEKLAKDYIGIVEKLVEES